MPSGSFAMARCTGHGNSGGWYRGERSAEGTPEHQSAAPTVDRCHRAVRGCARWRPPLRRPDYQYRAIFVPVIVTISLSTSYAAMPWFGSRSFEILLLGWGDNAIIWRKNSLTHEQRIRTACSAKDTRARKRQINLPRRSGP